MATKKPTSKKKAVFKKKSSKDLTGTTHKERASWYFSRSTFPLRDAPPTAIENYWEHAHDFKYVPGVRWEESGPTNIPGRVTSLVATTWNSPTLYAGTAAGGVWSCDTGTGLWKPCWSRFLTHNIGALAIHPDGKSLVCATGEGNLSSDSYPGSGIFETSNGGLTWKPFFTAIDSKGRIDDSVRESFPRRVGSIAFAQPNPDIGNRVGLGGVSSSEQMPAALYLHTGRELMTVTHWGDRSYNCYSVLFRPEPDKRDWVYAAVEVGGVRNGIWLSRDFGNNWIHLTKGLPPPEQCQRISLAMAPSDPNVIYALISRRISHSVLGVFRSNDGGDNWTPIAGDHFVNEKQLSYNNCIAVHPNDPDFVVCGATELHVSRNGGKDWKQVTTDQPGNHSKPVKNYCHSDHHAIVITPDSVIYSGNDGGVSRSTDGGKTWQSFSEGMVTAMFYAADVAPSNSKIFGGGTQDNGTIIAGVPAKRGKRPPSDPHHFVQVIDGDGGWLRFDPGDAEKVFASTSAFIVYLHKRGDRWAKGDVTVTWKKIPIESELLSDSERGLRSAFVMAIDPTASKRAKSVYLGTSRLWRTQDDGRTWEPISGFLDGTAISAIAICKQDPKLMALGTSGGNIYRSLDAGNTWSENLAGSAVPPRIITQLAFHPADKRTIVCTVGSTGMPGASLAKAFGAKPRPFGHVYISFNGGDIWNEIDRGELPDVVYNALAFETIPPYRIFVGGDAGVWMTTMNEDQPESLLYQWANISGNMPNVVVSDLNFHHKDRILTAATYGRGIWRLKAREPLANEVLNIPVDTNADPGPLISGWLPDHCQAGPVLVAPADGFVSTDPKTEVRFEWQPVEGAIGYAISVFNESGFPIDDTVTGETHAAVGFIWGTPDTWQVWALFEENLRSLGSARRILKVATSSPVAPPAPAPTPAPLESDLALDPGLPAPELIAPADKAVIENQQLELSWKPVANATGYGIALHAANVQANSLTTTDTKATIVANVPAGSWEVFAVFDGKRRSPASETRTFTTKA